ncbi:hypothetical protein [Cesiribacter sp. SM1]|uniref:hypothetical protein n=1 Tax=Cesiribacter sp. SM1 TaxID=2861196 RepID=UPI001CD60432|nr:hypothetical protein [Cesiribacter sp. SM1]
MTQASKEEAGTETVSCLNQNHITEGALKSLCIQLSWQPPGYNITPEKFTAP